MAREARLVHSEAEATGDVAFLVAGFILVLLVGRLRGSVGASRVLDGVVTGDLEARGEAVRDRHRAHDVGGGQAVGVRGAVGDRVVAPAVDVVDNVGAGPHVRVDQGVAVGVVGVVLAALEGDGGDRGVRAGVGGVGLLWLL